MKRKKALMHLAIAHSYMVSVGDKHCAELRALADRLFNEVMAPEEREVLKSMSRNIEKYALGGLEVLEPLDYLERAPMFIIDNLMAVLVGWEGLGGKYSQYRKLIKKCIKFTAEEFSEVINYDEQHTVEGVTDAVFQRLFKEALT